jgi:hypothetical protein
VERAGESLAVGGGRGAARAVGRWPASSGRRPPRHVCSVRWPRPGPVRVLGVGPPPRGRWVQRVWPGGGCSVRACGCVRRDRGACAAALFVSAQDRRRCSPASRPYGVLSVSTGRPPLVPAFQAASDIAGPLPASICFSVGWQAVFGPIPARWG